MMKLKTKDEEVIGKRDWAVIQTYWYRRRRRHHHPVQAGLGNDERSGRGGDDVDGVVAHSKRHIVHDQKSDRVVHVRHYPGDMMLFLLGSTRTTSQSRRTTRRPSSLYHHGMPTSSMLIRACYLVSNNLLPINRNFKFPERHPLCRQLSRHTKATRLCLHGYRRPDSWQNAWGNSQAFVHQGRLVCSINEPIKINCSFVFV